MRSLLLLPLLAAFALPAQDGAAGDDGSSVTVLSFKWVKTRQTVAAPDNDATAAPAGSVTPADKNFQRNVRINEPARTRDVKEDDLDVRSAALEKNVQEARKAQPKRLDGFTYKVKVQNAGDKVIEIVFFEYQFTESAAPSNTTRRQFLCGVNIKPGKEKELSAFSLSGPSEVVSVESLGNKDANLFREKVVINRVEYSDGSIWQRKDWNFAEIKQGYTRAVGTPWTAGEMCRGL
jgi:hypothetical protein